MNTDTFITKGWQQFGYEEDLARWVKHTLPFARSTIADEEFVHWMRCENTWFAGVNALPNDEFGNVGDSGPLQCQALTRLQTELGFGAIGLDRAQVSICYPGYPKPHESESAAAFRFRRDRDAAHVDGIRPEGPGRRRYLREYHGYVLGIPMAEFSADAAPFVIWEDSHEIVREAFRTHFVHLPPDKWEEQDITEIYQQTRQKVFDMCERIEIYAQPGESYIAHRLSVHGVAPWGESASAGSDARMICYFRPEIAGASNWLNLP